MAQNGQRTRPAPMSTTVRSTERLSDSMVRIVVGGPDLVRFQPSVHADSYVKVLFLNPLVDYARPLDLNRIRAEQPAENWPRLRSYTVRRWNQAALELTLDFVVHGDDGLAGPWAAKAQVGDELLLQGPGGGYSPDPAADWYLLIGDESALPAIAVILDALPDDARGQLFVEVHGPGDEVALRVPDNLALTWVHRTHHPVGQLLVDAVRAAAVPAGTVSAFVHGEAGFVKQLRGLLRIERGVPADQLSISGYWRSGTDDEGWRAGKSAWNSEVEQAEIAAGVS